VGTIESLLEAITAFGDPGFILAASLGLAAALIAAGDRRTAVALLVAIATSATIIAAAKIGFMAFGAPHLHSPSGHAAIATTFFFSLGATLLKTRAPARAGAAACGIFALIIAASRVLIGVHSVAEAAIGVAIGFSAFVLFHNLAAPRTAVGQGPLVVCFATAICLHAAVGESISFEEPLEHVAAALGRLAR
jgi:membrane-associated phospholipid phosphatase